MCHRFLKRYCNLVLKWSLTPTNHHGWSKDAYGGAEFISHECVTTELAVDVLRLEAE